MFPLTIARCSQSISQVSISATAFLSKPISTYTSQDYLRHKHHPLFFSCMDQWSYVFNQMRICPYAAQSRAFPSSSNAWKSVQKVIVFDFFLLSITVPAQLSIQPNHLSFHQGMWHVASQILIQISLHINTDTDLFQWVSITVTESTVESIPFVSPGFPLQYGPNSAKL